LIQGGCIAGEVDVWLLRPLMLDRPWCTALLVHKQDIPSVVGEAWALPNNSASCSYIGMIAREMKLQCMYPPYRWLSYCAWVAIPLPWDALICRLDLLASCCVATSHNRPLQVPALEDGEHGSPLLLVSVHTTMA
jgi:hypothetical protein